jgi:hypothetical protein
LLHISYFRPGCFLRALKKNCGFILFGWSQSFKKLAKKINKLPPTGTLT